MIVRPLLAVLVLGVAGHGQQEKDKADPVGTTFAVPPDLNLRVRVAAATPAAPLHIHWRYGGEGLGGGVTQGKIAEGLSIGTWSAPVAVASFAKKFPKRMFLTFTMAPAEKGASLRSVEAEFEFSFKGKVLKTVRESGPDGPTVGLYIPAYRLTGSPEAPEFLSELGGLSHYAVARAEKLEKLPWAGLPLPKKYAVLTDLGGYGAGAGYGVRHTSRAVVEAETRTLRQLGVNGLRARPAFLEGAKDFSRAVIDGHMGFPVSSKSAGGGCPFAAEAAAGSQKQIEGALAYKKHPAEEVWLLTVDEIGTIYHQTAEGKHRHPAVCAACGEAYRKWLKGQGLSPADFGKRDWSEVRPLDLTLEKGASPPWMADPHAARSAFYTSAFGNVATAATFTPLRDALGRLEDKGPRLLSYALRGNNFLMSGSSLDFFEFYRHADNAFVYETSNRDPRIWSWDSYLCDVGRMVSRDRKIGFGIYVKPHRGAPVQRMLAAASRGARMIYWYTYGPDYWKGDSFSQSPEILERVSLGARLLGKSEEVLYGSSFARPAEVAVVNPWSSERWLGLSGGSPARAAAWENAKWTYTALQHAHVAVDPLDEVMLASSDLSRYKALYISGPHLTRTAAAKVAEWVRAGGTLYTSGGGLALDEANQPLAEMNAVLGLRRRTEPQMSFRVQLYGGTSIDSYSDPKRVLAPVPEGAKLAGRAPFPGSFAPVVGREVLDPSTAEVLVNFADGGAAVTRNRFGQGQAWTVGFFPGLEYSAAVRTEGFDMSKDFQEDRRAYVTAPALERVKPVVDASHPAVEGVLLRNDATGKLAVTLANWAYRAGGLLVPHANLKVTIRGVSIVRATSALTDQPLALDRSPDSVTVTLPRLAEGDVLLLEEGR